VDVDVRGLGRAELLKQSGEHPAVRRGHVTSPGGATADGRRALERASLRAALDDAVQAVYERALELSPPPKGETSGH
jgi:pyrroline-5-carboxylate reductase